MHMMKDVNVIALTFNDLYNQRMTRHAVRAYNY
jgi:hypothetical protein